jgi:hypothetical protein
VNAHSDLPNSSTEMTVPLLFTTERTGQLGCGQLHLIVNFVIRPHLSFGGSNRIAPMRSFAPESCRTRPLASNMQDGGNKPTILFSDAQSVELLPPLSSMYLQTP